MPILWFAECDDAARVGGKAAGMARLIRAGIDVPPGFAITTDGFRAVLDGGLGDDVAKMLDGLHPGDTDELEAVSAEVRHLIETAPMPPPVRDAVRRGYEELARRSHEEEPDALPVAVRSSATAEDLPDASFAGQQDTYLWVKGADAVVEHVRRCWASLYTTRAVSYRIEQGFPHDKVLMSVCVQKMVDARSAGVMFTLNPINGDRSKVAIEASWGLGETVVSGEVTPDQFLVDKVTYDVVRREISPKVLEARPHPEGLGVVRTDVPPERATTPSLSDDEVVALARLARKVEAHHGVPQDLEWALGTGSEGDSRIYLLQSRPETVWSTRPRAPVGDAGTSTLDHIVARLVRGVRVRDPGGPGGGRM